jgi:hypothetical protein
MELRIELIDGRWTVNGKKLSEMSEQEARFLNEFFQELRQGKDSQLLTKQI